MKHAFPSRQEIMNIKYALVTAVIIKMKRIVVKLEECGSNFR